MADGARPLTGRRIVLGVSGGIGAYKAALAARLLVGRGAQVDTILTRGGQRFVGTPTFEGITGRAARSEVWEEIPSETHVALGRAADAILIYPATAHLLAKLATGFADDLLTTSLLVARCPVVIAPAMHTEMWQHAATSHNVEVLRSRGVVFVGPEDGPLMGGDSGPGRLAEPEAAVDALQAAVLGSDDQTAGTQPAADPSLDQDLTGVRILVTAGGTREPIDPVRFLGNRSSGKMGFAIAEDAAARGATVTLVAGPSALDTPPGVRRVDVTTATDMHDAVMAAVDDNDVIIKAAAVADFRPANTSSSKLKKDAGIPTIELVRNPDILADLGARRQVGQTRPLLVGFAAETDDVEASGRRKLERKGADLLLVNDVSADDAGFEVDTNRGVLLDRDGGSQPIHLASKHEVASQLLDAVARRLGRSS